MESIFDILECSVCLERLDATSRILPCQHTFCLRCLTTIFKTNNDLRCPECRGPVPIREVKELPPNILLVRILEGLKRPPRPPGTTEDSTLPEVPIADQLLKTNLNVFKPTRPFARAKFKYEAKEAGDLSFDKGDIIFLKKKLDDHWFVGEISGQMGFFPANHVEVQQPLVEEVPWCKALYDFEVSETEERDLLTFNKDEVLKVIRRVDDNWVEGQKGERIGIFPISFVEFNDPAKSLIDAQQTGQQQGGGERTSHSPHGSGGEGPSTADQGASGVTRRQSANRNKTTAKRHSFTSVLGLQLRQKDGQDPANGPNRHSMEISSPELVRSSNPLAATILGARQQGSVASTVPPTVVSTNGTTLLTNTGGSRRRPPPLAPMPQQVLLGGGSLPGSPSAVGTATSPRPNVEVYRARYSYKPQNQDELELQAGEAFTAYEMCADGWLRGMSLSTGRVGVFPGNYVEPYRIEETTRPRLNASSGHGPSAFPLLAPSSQQPARSRSPNGAPAVTSQPPGGRVTTSPPSALLHQDHHKTVAQLQAEKLRQYQLLREMTSRGGGGNASSASPRGSPPTGSLGEVSGESNAPLGARNPTAGAPNSLSAGAASSATRPGIPSIQLGEPSAHPAMPTVQTGGAPTLRSGQRTPGACRRPASGTGVPMSAFERTNHDTSGPALPENSARSGGYRRHGARGRSKSASRISSQKSRPPEEARRSNNGSSSPEEEREGSLGGPRSQVYRKRGSVVVSSSSPVQQHLHETTRSSPPPGYTRRYRPRCHSEGNLRRLTRQTGDPPTPACPPRSPTPMSSSHFASISSHPKDRRTIKEKMRRKSSSDHPQQGPPPPIRTTPPIQGAVGGGDMTEEGPPSTVPLVRERYHVIDPYPVQSDSELGLSVGDIIFVHTRREDGWYRGTSQGSGRTGWFPGTFVEKL